MEEEPVTDHWKDDHRRNSKTYRMRTPPGIGRKKEKGFINIYKTNRKQRVQGKPFSDFTTMDTCPRILDRKEGMFRVGKTHPKERMYSLPQEVSYHKLLPLLKHKVIKLSVARPRDLFDAIEAGDLDCTKRALEKGWKESIHMKDEEGRTPFYRACELGRLQIAQHLWKQGADTNERSIGSQSLCQGWIKGPHGLTPLEIAKANQHKHLVQWLSHLQ